MFGFNLSTGEVQVYDNTFNKLFSVNCYQNTQRRFMINLVNPVRQQNDGNFFIITDGNEINVNMWCNLL